MARLCFRAKGIGVVVRPRPLSPTDTSPGEREKKKEADDLYRLKQAMGSLVGWHHLSKSPRDDVSLHLPQLAATTADDSQPLRVVPLFFFFFWCFSKTTRLSETLRDCRSQVLNLTIVPVTWVVPVWMVPPPSFFFVFFAHLQRTPHYLFLLTSPSTFLFLSSAHNRTSFIPISPLTTW